MYLYIWGGNEYTDKEHDAAKPHVHVGPYVIQSQRVFYLPRHVNPRTGVVAALEALPGVRVREERGYQHAGSSHYCLTVRVENEDGSLIYSVRRVIDCPGTGWCSYSHGPWEEYGTYAPPAQAD